MHRGLGKTKSGSLKFAINAEVCPALETFAAQGYKGRAHMLGVCCWKVLAFKWLLLFAVWLPVA